MSDKRKPTYRWREAGWNTYNEAYAAFRGLVQKLVDMGLRPGNPIPAECNEALLWLIDGHPGIEEKTAGGVRYFMLHANGLRGYAGYGFSLVNGLGAEHSFKLETALRGFGSTDRQMTIAALRAEVQKQHAAVRKQARENNLRCPVTGELLTDKCEVDHVGLDFSDIAKGFLAAEGLQAGGVTLVFEGDAGVRRPLLADRGLAVRWHAYHAATAKLEAVSVEGHRIRTRDRRENPFFDLKS